MRVAALLPAATDIVLALGAGNQLVAVTHACALPPRFAHVPRVTRSRLGTEAPAGVDAQVSELADAGAPLFDLDETALAAAQPDVILTQAVCDVCAVREQDARAVAARIHPTPKIVTLGASTVQGILDDILAVGAALDIDDADELVLGLKSRIAAVHRRLKASQAPRRSVIVLEWTDPLFGAGHWVPDMVRRAGGTELVGRIAEASVRTSLEEVRGRDPELIVVAPCGYSLEQAAAEARQLAPQLGGAMWILDANSLTSSPGPGVVRGIEVLAKVFHPDLFGRPRPSDALPLGSDL